mmetsp:Transcript_64910/g.120804  ORF Transcript_64910/g.120804 Transcript_64910/m.120804 type:complete len:634 (-) Transcript_64910:235-2136(-)
MAMRKSLQEWGAWGNQILGEARTQAAPILQQAAENSTNVLKTGADNLRKGVSNVKFFAGMGETHSFKDPKTGETTTLGEIALLAEGGFGSVCKVRDTASGEDYAMKKILCQEGVQVASTAAAAKWEAEVLQRLPPHPHIIRCFGFSSEASGPNNSLVKILLEFCPRGHLLDFMDQHNGILSLGQILTPFVQVCAAVRHLHAQQPPIQHRDLKAENILRFSDKVWKLCDFGSCSSDKILDTAELSRKQLQDLQDDIDKTVTLLYRPPEMANVMHNSQGVGIGEAVDLWMLGCVFYTLVFYKHPFQDNPTVLAISNAKYFVPRDHANAKNAKLCCIVHWLLSPCPADRPTARKLCEVLKDYSKLSAEAMQAMVPAAVNEKVKRYAELYDSRRDDDMLDLPDLSTLSLSKDTASAVLQAHKELQASGPAQRPAKARNQARPAAPAQAPAPPVADMLDFADFTASSPSAPAPQAATPASEDLGFDIAFALGGGTAAAEEQAVRATPSEPARQPRARAKTTPAELDNLLDMGPAPPQPLRHISSPAGFNDLLGDLMEPPSQVAPAPAAVAPQQKQDINLLEGLGDFMSAPPAPTLPQQAPVQQSAAAHQQAPAAAAPGAVSGNAAPGSFWADFGHLSN